MQLQWRLPPATGFFLANRLGTGGLLLLGVTAWLHGLSRFRRRNLV